MSQEASIVICGAGYAGLTAAFHLAVRLGVRDVLLVDEQEPLTLSSDKGTEGYRNWWPGPDDLMVRFMSRSIDLLDALAEETGNVFDLNRRGYAFMTAEPGRLKLMRENAQAVSAWGAGEVRIHHHGALYTPSPPAGLGPNLDGADLVTDSAVVHELFPDVAADVAGMLHVRRAGWFDSRKLGDYLLDQFRRAGGRVVQDRVTGVEVRRNRVQAVQLAQGGLLPTETFVIAAGPYLREVGQFIGVDFPVFNELHAKLTLPDTQRVAPRDAPLLIWSDPLVVPWREEERDVLAADRETQFLTRALPSGVHVRTRGDNLLIIWNFDPRPVAFQWPARFPPYYGEVYIRGLARMLPGMTAYFGRGARGVVDGAYYCKTRENRPLIGPLPVAGAFVIGALSGFGLMGSQAAGELLAAHVTGGALPTYAADLSLARYADSAFTSRYEGWSATAGQL